MQSMTSIGKSFWVLVLFALLIQCAPSSQVGPKELNVGIIPLVQQLDQREGSIRLDKNWIITADLGLESIQSQLEDFLQIQLDLILGNSERTRNQIELQLDEHHHYGIEGYQLMINANGVKISSDSEIGIQRAIASLEQLILLNEKDGQYYLPFITIEDWARFAHRGLLLDCSRHFFSVEVVKKYIDLLSFYKMNTLHWHLTEDQAWRIYIDRYPKLTEIGAFRKEHDGSVYGGFYTKDDIREVVAYAQSRHIEIIPEIEMPGHSQAALAAYSQLSCTGEDISVANDWGVFKEIYCAGNDSVFTFLEDVLLEVFELFPSDKIHIGGDEAPKTRWEECPKCQKRIQDEGLKDEHELQSFFIKRIQSFLKANGKELIGWDEILEGGLAEGAIVQSWRGMEGGIDAAKNGNQAIMSPTSHAYLDYGLDAIDLKKVYSFEPIPSELNKEEKKLILGGECNMWTEHVPDEKTLDSKVFPRMIAMAEVLWSDSTHRSYNEFVERLQLHYSVLDDLGVDYGEEAIPLRHSMLLDSGQSHIELIPYAANISLQYQYNCEDCDTTWKAYDKPIAISVSGQIRVQAFRNGKTYGDQILIPLAHHNAICSKVDYVTPINKWYSAGGETALVDGKLGSLNFRDGAWQGFSGEDFVCTIQLPASVDEVSSLQANFYQYINSWILLPTELKVEVSSDGQSWKEWGVCKRSSESNKRGKFIETFAIQSDTPFNASYIRMHAANIGKLPDWHEAAGSDAWLFIDEIVIK
jgi:hexosaminidase